MTMYALRPLMGAFPINLTNSYLVLINGIPQFIDAGSLTVTNTIGKRSQASFTVHQTDLSTHFEQWQQVVIYDSTNSLVFSGYITTPQEVKPGFQPSLEDTITCTDQHYLADKRIIAKSYVNQPRSAIVTNIALTLLAQEGVTIGAIVDELGNANTLYPSSTLYPSTTLYPEGNSSVGLINATFAYCTVSQALDALTKDMSLAGIPYYWSIDRFKQFWWVPYTYKVNSNVIDGTLIEHVKNQTKVTRANPTYRNQQYVIGGVAQTTQQTETRVGDGNTTSWTMGYELFSAPSITVNGVAQSVGVKGTTGAQFYWAQGSEAITQDSSQAKLTSSQTLQVVYIGQFPSVVMANNGAQIGYQANLDGTSGIVEVADSAPTITTLGDGMSKANGLLTRYSVQGIQLDCWQLNNAAAYWPGQLVTVNLPEHGLNNVQMLIEETDVTDQPDNYSLWNNIKAVVGPYDTTWVDFWGPVVQSQAPATNINVGASQGLVSLIQFNVSLSPSATLTTNVYSCPLPSTTQYPNLTLYPC